MIVVIPNDSEHFRFYVREIVYDFYVAGIGNKTKIEKLQRVYSRFWKDD